MAVAVNAGHAPEVHVSNAQRPAPVHGQGPVTGREVVVDAGVNAHLL